MKTGYTKTEQAYLQVVGQKIREARQNLGLSQEKFALSVNSIEPTSAMWTVG